METLAVQKIFHICYFQKRMLSHLGSMISLSQGERKKISLRRGSIYDSKAYYCLSKEKII